MSKHNQQSSKTKAARVKALPWAALLQASVAIGRRWRGLSERDRARLKSLVGDRLSGQRGRLSNLSSKERRELRRLAGKLDVKGMGSELRALLYGKRRGRRR